MNYFEKIHNRKTISFISSNILQTEIKPLCISFCIKIITEIEFVIKFSTKRMKTNNFLNLKVNRPNDRTYTWTAFMRFPLSKRDSNKTVVSSGLRSGKAAGRQPSRFPPIRERINYSRTNKKMTNISRVTYITACVWWIIKYYSSGIFIVTTCHRSSIDI